MAPKLNSSDLRAIIYGDISEHSLRALIREEVAPMLENPESFPSSDQHDIGKLLNAFFEKITKNRRF